MFVYLKEIYLDPSQSEMILDSISGLILLNHNLTSSELDAAKTVIHSYRNKLPLPGMTEDKLWEYKNIYDSAFHPETGEKMFILGRMAFQVPGNMVITGCMLQFYK
ncbi:unnamed protein product [Protopolystoma xenopodis]|uniref:Uncharacterized protein n=1 Tax=Protopolystoma xenopodis TaxID=117903 RepID=A0A3S5A9Z7_9PLAT|nr:unnamed protein product [Protopolystoma xenopodis]